MESAIFTAKENAPKRRKQTKKKKNKNGFVVSHEKNELKTCKKRKFSDTLNEECGATSSYLHKSSKSPLNISADNTEHVDPKRAKTATGVTVEPITPVSSFPDGCDVDSGFSSEISPPTSGRSSPSVGITPSMLVALDCEMVGTGPRGTCSELARCSLVDYYGKVIYDKYVLPCQPVTNYRTRWSGITRKHLRGALPFAKARNEVLHILKEKIIIGHALNNDFQALEIRVPRYMIRDTSCCRLLRQMCGSKKVMSLKKMTSTLLKRTIQDSRHGHCSVEDSRAALDLYKLVEDQWERSLQALHGFDSDSDSESDSSLDHYMQDEYWPDSVTDCNQ